MIKKSIGASLLISIGVYGLLYTNYSIFSMILFSFGLFAICVLQLNLFTGKCGFIFETKNFSQLIKILMINLISGYIFGFIFSFINSNFIIESLNIVCTWDFSFSYFVRSAMCGIIMYLAVLIYRKGTSFGIFLGIPLFIMCGFQHSIANVIIMGVSKTFNPAIIICIIGNFIGSIFMYFIVK